MLRDLVYATRTLRKAPVFAATAVLTIALGIGAATTIFSVTHAVLLKPLPYKQPDRLAFIISDLRNRGVKDFPLSNADFLDIRNGTSQMFADVAGVFTFRQATPRQDGTLEETRAAVASINLFHTLGAHILYGRDFNQADGQPIPAPAPAAAGQPAPPPAAPQATILSYEYFERRFGGDRSIIGHDMPGAPPGFTTIVGVLAPGFQLLFPPSADMEAVPDAWYAARIDYDAANRNTVSFHAIARMKPGVSLERAQSALDIVAADARRQFVIEKTAGYALRIEPMHRHIVEEVRPALIALMGAVVFLLLIACANVANLMLVRASLKERELAIRTALGGNWWRLARQSFAEALLLAAAGAGLGLVLAWYGIDELHAIAPENLPRLDAVSIDPTVIGFAALAALFAAAFFGLFPAWRASRPDVAIILRAGGRTSGLASAGFVRNAVVVAEVALCFVLLIGSGLMVRSFLALQHINPGFDSHGLLVFELLRGNGAAGRQPAQRAAFMREVESKLRAIPGVQAVAASFPFPLTGGFSPIRWGLADALADPAKFRAVDFQVVLPGYFETMHVPLIAGRAFTDADNSPDRDGVVIDQDLAAKAFPNQDAIGKRLLVRVQTPQPVWVQVLGVVAHQRDTTLAEAGREQIYFTDGYLGHAPIPWWAIRVTGDPARYAGALREQIGSFGSRLALNRIDTMEALVGRSQSHTRFSLLLIGAFAIVAALLAAVGLYGVLSTVVRQRTAEIGVRMALGAAPAGIFKLVVGQGLRLSGIGIGLGVVAAYNLTRVMRTMLIGTKPTDPATFIAIVALFIAIVVLASWLPARRAAALDPTTALRSE
jgi:predicted permease